MRDVGHHIEENEITKNNNCKNMDRGIEEDKEQKNTSIYAHIVT